MNQCPRNSATRPNWYKWRLPPYMTEWAIECLSEHVDVTKYQPFTKVSISCKNNGKAVFIRLLFESRLYQGAKQHGAEKDLIGLPVSYLIEVNKAILKGNKMEYNIGDDIKYHEVYPVYNLTTHLEEDCKLQKEKKYIYKYVKNFKIPLVNTKK